MAAYVGFLLFVATAFSANRARSEVEKFSLTLGRDMQPLADLLSERGRINMNGQHLWAGSSVSSQPIDQILDRYEAACRAAGVEGKTWGDIGQSDVTLFAPSDGGLPGLVGSKFGVFRSRRGDEGAVLCFTGDVGRGSLSDRLIAFSKSHDFGDLGRLRYMFARREKDASHVLTLWSDDHLRLDRLAGVEGEEAGADHPSLPRPIEATRTFSGGLEGTAYEVFAYRSKALPEAVLSAYGAEMQQRGWKETLTSDARMRGYSKDGVFVTVGVDASPHGSTVGIATMGVDR